MIEQSPCFKQLLRALQQVPYLANKNIYRVANHFLLLDQARAQQFCMAIMEAKKKIVYCGTCYAWKEHGQPCMFCDSAKRDQSVICVVETWHELVAIEKTEGYKGVYHILGGAICPLEGVGPEDLTITGLVERVNTGQQEVKELILATNQTPEGQATAAFIANKVKDVPLTISCLARGVPVGSSLEFMDRVTVYKALCERRPF